MRNKKAIFYQVVVPGLVAILIGVLEAGWTRPDAGGPANTWMGVFAILGIFSLVSFPRLWRIPLLAIIEEITHLILSVTFMGAPIDLAWDFVLLKNLFNHWSIGYIGFNIYPYITFPLLTLLGEILYKYFKAMR